MESSVLVLEFMEPFNKATISTDCLFEMVYWKGLFSVAFYLHSYLNFNIFWNKYKLDKPNG